MRNVGKVLFAVLVTASVVGLILALSPQDGGQAMETTASPVTPQPQSTPRPLVEAPTRDQSVRATPRLTGQSISLSEAVAIAEKLGKGQAVKAERREKPEVGFRIDLLDADGAKAKVELSADGHLRQHR